jgi:hypothetical protein
MSENGKRVSDIEIINPNSSKKIKKENEEIYRCDICRACFKSVPLIQKHCLGNKPEP